MRSSLAQEAVMHEATEIRKKWSDSMIYPNKMPRDIRNLFIPGDIFPDCICAVGLKIPRTFQVTLAGDVHLTKVREGKAG